MEVTTRIVIFQWCVNSLRFKMGGLFLSSSLSALFACSLSLSENSEIDNLLGCPIGHFQFK